MTLEIWNGLPQHIAVCTSVQHGVWGFCPLHPLYFIEIKAAITLVIAHPNDRLGYFLYKLMNYDTKCKKNRLPINSIREVDKIFNSIHY